MRLHSTALMVALSAAPACVSGGSSSSLTGTATVNGTLNGHAFQAADAVAATAMLPVGGTTTTVSAGMVTIASSPGLCAAANATTEPKNTQFLLLAFTDINPATGQTSPPAAPGVYVVSGAGSQVGIAFSYQTDASCHLVAGASESATAGTITLTSVSGGSYSGSFDLTMTGSGTAPADHITGSFSSPYCPASATFANLNRTTTCF